MVKGVGAGELWMVADGWVVERVTSCTDKEGASSLSSSKCEGRRKLKFMCFLSASYSDDFKTSVIVTASPLYVALMLLTP